LEFSEPAVYLIARKDPWRHPRAAARRPGYGLSWPDWVRYVLRDEPRRNGNGNGHLRRLNEPDTSEAELRMALRLGLVHPSLVSPPATACQAAEDRRAAQESGSPTSGGGWRLRLPALRVANCSLGRFGDFDVPDQPFDAVFSATAFHWVEPAVGWVKAAAYLEIDAV
jgi:hypothetical protein